MKATYVLVLYAVVTICNGFQCNVKGKCVDSTLEGATTASSNEECLKKCFDNSQCKWYSFLGVASKQCIQFSDCNTLDESCSTCTSGQRECFEHNDDCTINGCCQGVTIDYTNAQNLQECRQSCLDTGGQCQWFSFNLAQKFCLLLKDCTSVTNQDQDVCTSGHITDDCSEDCTEVDGCCQGNVLSYETSDNVEDCRQRCESYSGCQWFSYTLDSKLCLLMSTCDHFTQENAGVCTSGPMNCTDGPPVNENDLILIALGKNGADSVRSVELLDLSNQSGCIKSTNAPQESYGGVGALISTDSAIFCGGTGLNDKCMALNEDVTWSMSTPLNNMRISPGIGRSYNNKLFVTGGLGTTIHDTMEYYNGQKWTSLNGRMPKHLYQHCQVSLPGDRSLIMGGYTLDAGVTKSTFYVEFNINNGDETTLFEDGPSLLENRQDFACAYDADKKMVIAAGGGQNDAISTEILYLDRPVENWQKGPNLPNNQPLTRFQLVYHAYTKSVYLIGGKNPNTNVESTSIWRLQDDLQWSLVNNLQLQNGRDGFIAFNVPRTFMTC